MEVDILGTTYEFVKKNYNEDEAFERSKIIGYCDFYSKKIVVCKMRTHKTWDHESDATCAICENETSRHEIVHAFLNESGLDASSITYNDSWARNEEMIDWIAKQGPKIYEAWRKVDCV